jgi:hypothetical protein
MIRAGEDRKEGKQAAKEIFEREKKPMSGIGG